MVLVYTHKITPRLRYTFEYCFEMVLEIPFELTTDITDFVAHSGIKMSYTERILGEEFFVESHPLLFQKTIQPIEIDVKHWEKELPCFFDTGKDSSIPFDVFAAIFYLITRYEEYSPHRLDESGGFSFSESIAFKNNFLTFPVVDRWLFKFWGQITATHSHPISHRKNYRFLPVFNIVAPYRYKHKSFFDNIFGFCYDFFSLKFRISFRRFATMIRYKKDPYDIYNTIIKYKKEQKIDIHCFFLVCQNPYLSKKSPLKNYKYPSLMKKLADYLPVGLMSFYKPFINNELLEKETKHLAGILHHSTDKYTQMDTHLIFPDTYRNLLRVGIKKDFSMGYADALGFRAGTCTPFYFYDLAFEQKTRLKIYPFCMSDEILKNKGYTPEQAFQKTAEIQARVRAVSGVFIPVFRPSILSDYNRWQGWQSFFTRLLKMADDR